MKINLAMIVRNEERYLGRCLEATASFVDDIIIVDTGSTDQTKEIARAFGEKSGKRVLLYDFAWTNDFSAARNFSLLKSETDGGADYSLVIDADERLRTTKLSNREGLEAFIRETEEQRAISLSEKRDFSPAAWCGAVRLIEERKGRRGEPLTCLRIIPRLMPRGARFRGIVCETPNSSVVLSPLLVDHEEYDREKKAEKRLPYLIRAMAAEPEEPFWKYQMAAALVRLGRTEESLPYFEDFYRMLMARYPDVTDQSAYREPYARQGILAYLYALDEMRGEKYRQRALHILLRQEPHMHSSADFYFFCGDFFMELVQTRTQRYITYLPRVEQSFVRCLQIGENTSELTVIGNGSFRAFYRLGVWYELTNQPQHAQACYESAAQMGYEPAMRRMGMQKK
jgi:glycosyltransferase involved in cell wall biosynthesis